MTLVEQDAPAHAFAPPPGVGIDTAAATAAQPDGAEALFRIEGALVERDAQIAELQQAVLELANSADEASLRVTSGEDDLVAALSQRIAALENRLIEQDRTIRQTLTMLIEWIETDELQRAA